jgi:hypothetical protein
LQGGYGQADHGDDDEGEHHRADRLVAHVSTIVAGRALSALAALARWRSSC